MAKERCNRKNIALFTSIALVSLIIFYGPFVNLNVTCSSDSVFCRWIIDTMSQLSPTIVVTVSSSNKSIVSTTNESTVDTTTNGNVSEGVTVDSSNVCSNQHCRRYSQYILDNMDQTVDPCDDFYQFACGGFIQSHPIREANDHIDDLTLKQARIYESLDSMIKKSKGNRLYSLIRHLYSSCTSESMDRRKDLRDFLDHIIKGGNNFYDDWANILIMNLDNVLTLEPIFDETSIEDSLTILLVRKLPHRRMDVSTYKQFIRESFAHILGDEPTKYNEVSENIVEFESAFYSSPKYGSYTNEFSWATLSQTIINKLSLKFALPAAAVPLPLDYIARRYASNGVLTAYLKWVVIRELAFLTGPTFRHIEAKYSSPSPLNRRCKNIILNYSNDLITKLYIEQSGLQDHFEGIQRLKNQTSAMFRELVQEKSWIPDETKDLVYEKLTHLKLDIGSSGWNLTDSFLRQKYLPLVLSLERERSFFSLLQKSARVATKYKFIDLHTKGLKGISATKFPETEVSYYFGKNVITIAASYLDETKYHPSLPNYVNYAGIGIDLAHELAHGYMGDSGEYDFAGRKEQDLITMTDEVANRSRCLIELYRNTVDPQTNLSLSGAGDDTFIENTADNTALKITTLMYDRVSSDGGEASLPNFQAFTPQQMFFIAYANNWCANTGSIRMRQLILDNAHAPHRYRVNIPLRNNRAFRSAFKCLNINEPICEAW